ncbi:MAG: DUF393 domain-containing protein [Acidobacteria bacterium]|nr:DUF393 domain-containing protein [Acidobacteriota bacterium]
MALSAINPLRITGTELAPPVLLMAKLIALALLLTLHASVLPVPFLPFLPGLDALPPQLFRTTLQLAMVIGALGILLNYRVRTACLLAGGAILLGVLSSRAYYGNNKTFCALILILAGLSSRTERRFLHWQVAIVYLGAGLNKALDPDWHSGQFFEHWATVRLEQPLYLWLSPMLPPLLLGKLMCWAAITLELSAAVMLVIPRLQLYGAAISIFLQSGFLLFSGQTFVLFFYGMQAAMFAFLPWPASGRMMVIYDGDCGFCDWCRRQLQRFDFDRILDWRPYQTGVGLAHGITDDMASRRLQLITTTGKVLDGFHAVRRMLIYTPALWFVFYALIALSPARQPLWRQITVGLALFLISPLFNPIGVAAYDFVARHRHRLMPNSTCAIRQ